MSEIYREQPDIEEREMKEQKKERLVKEIMEKHRKRMEELRENDYIEEPIPLGERRECGTEIEDLEWLIALFKKDYNLEALSSIDALTDEEALKHPIWGSAGKDLIPIDIILKTLERETKITSEKHEELFTQYKLFSNAVGMRNKISGKVEHDRNK